MPLNTTTSPAFQLTLPLPDVTSWDQLPLLLDTEDIMRLYRLSDPGTVSRWSRSGQIPPPTVKSGSVCRWDREIIREHLARRGRLR